MSGSPTGSGVPATSTPAPRSLRLLIVEDSEFDARFLINLFRQQNYAPQSRRVASRDELVDALKTGTWDALLCDHSLPGFSAPEALEIVHQSGVDVPFLIVSAGIGEDVAVAMMKAGAHDFLIKGNLARMVPAVEREIREAQVRAARRAAESALQQSEMRYRLVWENSTDAVLLLDTEGAIRFANPAAESLFGWPPAELVGRHIRTLQPESVTAGGWWTENRAGRNRWTDTPGLRKDGSALDLDVAFGELPLEGQPLVAAFIRDITESKRSAAELRRNREEFAAAREIQQRLFPAESPRIPGADIAGASFAADAAGGDYFDFLPLADGSLGLVVADVSGHGIGPALLMSETRSCLRILARTTSDPALILRQATRLLHEDFGAGRYVTLFLACYHPETRLLRYVSAGHPPAWILSPEGEARMELRRNGPPLGQRSDFEYRTSDPIPLHPGEICVVLTDGIIEASNGTEEFGHQRVRNVLHEARQLPASEMVHALRAAAKEFAGPRGIDDDITALVVKVL